MDADDLPLLTTKELLDELASRFETCVFVGQHKRTSVQVGECLFFHGNPAMALGLAQAAAIRFWTEKSSKSKPLF